MREVFDRLCRWLLGGVLALLATTAVLAQTSSSQPPRPSPQTATTPTPVGAAPASQPAVDLRPGAPRGADGAPFAQTPVAADANSPRVLLVAQKETTVVAQFVGQISRLGGEIGSAVSQGAPLVTFDCRELDARVKMSDAEVNASRQQFEAKQRLQSLGAAGDVEVQLAQATFEKAKAQLDVSRAQMRQCVLPAPFAGRIVKLHVKQFQAVNIGQPLVDLVSGGPLKVRLNAPSRWLSWLRVGTKFDVKVDETGGSYPAVVSAINGRVDAVSQSVEIEGRLEGTWPELLAGMSGNARFAPPAPSSK